MTQPANRTATDRARLRGYTPSKATQKDNRMTTIPATPAEDGSPSIELTSEGCSICLHNDSRAGLLVVIDDTRTYSIQGLDDESLHATMTVEAWRRLRASILSGVVDQALAAVG